MPNVDLYTDGAASGNPGPGGYGAVLRFNGHEKKLSQGYRRTTNNRMELLAVIVGLKALNKPCNVTVYSDSKYVCDAVEKKWLFSWEKTYFKKKKNPDLWIEFLKLYRQHSVRFVWIKGHAGHEYNEICDQLAVEASKGSDLKIDEGYEESVED